MYDWNEEPELNITPLVDIMLVLMAVLMITAPTIVYEETIKLPSGSKTKQISKIPEIELIVTKKRVVKIKNTQDKFKLAEFPDNFIRYKDQFPLSTTVYISADESLSYRSVMFVLKSVKEAGFTKVSLETSH